MAVWVGVVVCGGEFGGFDGGWRFVVVWEVCCGLVTCGLCWVGGGVVRVLWFLLGDVGFVLVSEERGWFVRVRIGENRRGCFGMWCDFFFFQRIVFGVGEDGGVFCFAFVAGIDGGWGSGGVVWLMRLLCLVRMGIGGIGGEVVVEFGRVGGRSVGDVGGDRGRDGVVFWCWLVSGGVVGW